MTLADPPPAASLLLDFVNTRDLAGSGEQLASGATFGAWLHGRGLVDRDVTVSDADAVAARELRTAFVAVLLAHAGHTDAVDAAATLRRFGELHPVLVVPGVEGCALTPAQRGTAGFVGRLLASAAELALTGAWPRLKACGNPPCRQGFYDRTRNGSGAYCSARPCGSQVAMRAYRERRARAAG